MTTSWRTSVVLVEAAPDAAGSDALRLAAIAGMVNTSIHEVTGLATDFLNQYNEISMILDYAEDMPDAILDFGGWRPRSYPDHFRASGFRDAHLLIEAYDLSPPQIRSRFNALVRELNIIVLSGLTALQHVLRERDDAPIGPAAAVLAREIRDQVLQLSCLINGAQSSARQSSVDLLFEESAKAPEPDASLSVDSADSGDQAAIDALFD